MSAYVKLFHSCYLVSQATVDAINYARKHGYSEFLFEVGAGLEWVMAETAKLGDAADFTGNFRMDTAQEQYVYITFIRKEYRGKMFFLDTNRDIAQRVDIINHLRERAWPDDPDEHATSFCTEAIHAQVSCQLLIASSIRNEEDQIPQLVDWLKSVPFDRFEVEIVDGNPFFTLLNITRPGRT